MATPCSNNPNEVIEKVVSAKTNADKFNTFVNGTDNQTVQLGSGIPTPTIRNVVRQVMADASWAKQFIADAPEGDLSLNNATAYGTQISRTLAERFGDVINVKDFGAKGDGVTDDTASIQAAINSSHHANTGIRDTIFFPHGKYKVTTITISNGQTVILSHPTLVSDSTAIEIHNGYAGTIIEYANITAVDCGIWIKGGKAAHIEHTRIDITHAPENSDSVYGIRFGGVDEIYAGNECVLSDCSIYANNYIDSYGLYVWASDMLFDNIVIVNFKYGVRDAGSSNFYSQIHGWLNITNLGVTGEAYTNALKNSALFYFYREIAVQNAYADCYQYALYCTDSQGLYRHHFDGLLVFHTADWPSSLPVYVLNEPSTFHKGLIVLSRLDVYNASEAVHYLSNKGTFARPGFYATNPELPHVYNMPPIGDVFYSDAKPGTEGAVMTAYREDRKTKVGNMLFNYYSSTDESTFRVNLFNPTFTDSSYILFSQSPNGGIFETPEIRPLAGGPYNLGATARPWDNLFANSGPWSSSDARQKDNIEAPSDALLKAWGAVGIKLFQFKDAISKKGDMARIHLGVIAQDVMSAFSSEGIDVTRYGLFGYDEWEDEFIEERVVDSPAEYDERGRVVKEEISHIEKRKTMSAGNSYKIRYEEALILEAAYQRDRYNKMEERIERLETLVAQLINNKT